MANHLQYEKSPYLLQHKDNPVSWYPWGEEAFRRAAEEDKPIFLSIGYSTCHWCHVMAHESFEDEEAAQILNRDFISIKVDREERPDVDAVYMSVCQAMTGTGGWPLTILMTPERKPFYAATYLPKHSNRYQTGLTELLQAVARLWRKNRQTVLETGEQVIHALQEEHSSAQGIPDRKLFQQAYRFFTQSFDAQWGGFGRAPKFPSPHNLLFLMHYSQVENAPEALHIATATLDAMARGGIHDHIGGGFARYSTDAKWLAPHFEKMLYDQAMLMQAYLRAYQLTGEKRYADVVHHLAEYVLRELTDANGGFYCGQDADSEGVEGKYYVFTPEEVKSVLGAQDGDTFCQLYDITSQGNFEGKSIPNLIGQTKSGWERNDSRLIKLREYRLKRTMLHKDDKILLAWNAWMIIAMAQAGFALADERYLMAAIQAEAFIREKMIDPRNRLFLRWRDGDATNAGQLEDYAVYALALTELYRATFEPRYLRDAILRANQMRELFEDKEHGGYYMTSWDAEHLIVRPKETYDGAIPSGNAAAAMVLIRLAYLTGDPAWHEAAEKQFRFLATAANEHPASSSYGLLAMMELLYPHRELVCVSTESLPEDLTAFLRTKPADNFSILLKTPEHAQALAECATFTEAYPLPEHGIMYYMCEGGACKTPVNDFIQLKQHLGEPITSSRN